jgi:hypothetical protein
MELLASSRIDFVVVARDKVGPRLFRGPKRLAKVKDLQRRPKGKVTAGLNPAGSPILSASP